ncbi:MAG: M48 metallopeptidase family protein [Candidatus Entotheonellia bacterium]
MNSRSERRSTNICSLPCQPLCMMAPLNVLEYLVVHELAHRLHPNHTAAPRAQPPRAHTQVRPYTWLRGRRRGRPVCLPQVRRKTLTGTRLAMRRWRADGAVAGFCQWP